MVNLPPNTCAHSVAVAIWRLIYRLAWKAGRIVLKWRVMWEGYIYIFSRTNCECFWELFLSELKWFKMAVNSVTKSSPDRCSRLICFWSPELMTNTHSETPAGLMQVYFFIPVVYLNSKRYRCGFVMRQSLFTSYTGWTDKTEGLWDIVAHVLAYNIT